MTPQLHVLLVDDDAQDRAIVASVLRRECPGIEVIETSCRKEFSDALEAGRFDLVVTDYQLHDFDGLAVLREVRSRLPDVPVIMFTGSGSEEIAVEAMKEGLEDYVLKSSTMIRLTAALRSALHRATERKRARDELSLYHDLVTHDVSNFAMAILAIVDRLLFQADGPLTAKQVEMLRRARRQGIEVGRLCDNARTLVRLRIQGQAPPAEPVRVAETLRRVGESVRSVHFDRPFSLHVDGSEDLTISGVPFLENVFRNLIDNAARYSLEGTSAAVEIRARRDGETVRMAFRNPIGVEEGIGPHLFSEGVRGRRSRGAGLGLSVAREIIERAGGKIEARIVREVDGKWAEFSIELPWRPS